MPLNEIPKYLNGEARNLIDRALEHAWQELRRDAPADVALDKRRLVSTIVPLASVGETDLTKLKSFSLHAARSARMRRLTLQRRTRSS